MAAPLTLLALLIELMFGYPKGLARAIGHPVTWMGKLIDWLDAKLNHEDASPDARRRAGAIAVFVLLAVVGIIAFVVEQMLLLLPLGLLAAAIFASTMLSQRSLFVHVADVAEALEARGLDAGREAVAKIVGRDTATLDEAGVARLESALRDELGDGALSITARAWTAVGIAR